jgi:hypothetical protein
VSTGRQLVFYSLSMDREDPRPDIEWQLELSLRSLRLFNTHVTVWVFVYGDSSTAFERRLERYRVLIVRKGRYEDRLAELAADFWQPLAQYPILHKFLNFREIVSAGFDAALLLDCDTVFFSDVAALFNAAGGADCSGIADIGARRGPYDYDPAYLDEEALQEIAAGQGLLIPPLFSCGSIVMSRKLCQELYRLESHFLGFALRFMCWMALHPVSIRGRFPECRGVEYLRRNWATLGAGNLEPIRFPSGNRWLLEQFALWFTLGYAARHEYIDLPARSVQYYTQFRSQSRPDREMVCCHYGSRNTENMKNWLSTADLPSRSLGPRVRASFARQLKGDMAAAPNAVRAARRSGPGLPGMDRYWALQPGICPCDPDLVSYLRDRNVSGRNLFHMGTGEHHVVGLSDAVQGRNNLLGLTVSKIEHQRYVSLVAETPGLARYYKVAFADIYCMSEGLLPVFDIVTLFHLGEYWREERRPEVSFDDEGVARLFIRKLVPGGELILYRGSTGFTRIAALFRILVREGLLEAPRAFRSLLVFRRI